MNLFIVLLGILLGLLGAIGLFSPDSLIRVVTRFWMHPRGLFLAMVLRLIFGIIMITAAPQTRAPLTIEIIGVLSIAGAVALPLIGFQRMQRLIGWWTSRSASTLRCWALIALFFGLFLIYACL